MTPAKAKAVADGLATYSTGKPCNLGLFAERTVSGNECLCDKHIAARKASASRRYIAQRPERLEKQKAYLQQNREAVREYGRAHYQSNRQLYVDRAAGWASINIERRREVAREWARRNMPAVLANVRNRQARKLNATPPWFGELDELVMSEAYDLAKRREAVTGIKWEVDHIVPLQGKKVCGLHVAGNIQVIPMRENRKKSNHHAVQ